MAAKVAKFERMKIDESYVSAYNMLASELAFRQIDPQVFLSSHPRPEDFPRIHKTFGVDRFVNLDVQDESLKEYARNNKLEVKDSHQSSIVPESSETKKLLGEIRQMREEGHTILIFCHEGFGRSTLLGKHLLLSMGVDPKTAARLISPFSIEERGLIQEQNAAKHRKIRQ